MCYGRRATIAMDSFFFVLGPITMAFSAGLFGLIAGRILVGLGIGVSAVVVPAYLGELSPAKLRGRIVELYEVRLYAGILLTGGSCTSNNGWHDTHAVCGISNMMPRNAAVLAAHLSMQVHSAYSIVHPLASPCVLPLQGIGGLRVAIVSGGALHRHAGGCAGGCRASWQAQ